MTYELIIRRSSLNKNELELIREVILRNTTISKLETDIISTSTDETYQEGDHFRSSIEKIIVKDTIEDNLLIIKEIDKKINYLEKARIEIKDCLRGQIEFL